MLVKDLTEDDLGKRVEILSFESDFTFKGILIEKSTSFGLHNDLVNKKFEVKLSNGHTFYSLYDLDKVRFL